MAPVDRLSALDTSFLLLESPVTPMHVMAVAVLDGSSLHDARGRLRLAPIRAQVERCLDNMPRLRQVVKFPPLGVNRPVWVDDASFDIERHVLTDRLPPPGGEAELLRWCEQAEIDLLDRSHPLWELWLVDGLAGGRVALVEKLHHALVDGVAGLGVTTALAVAPPDRAREPWTPGRTPSGMRTLAEAVYESAAEPARRALSSLAGGLAHPRRSWQRLGELASAATSYARSIEQSSDGAGINVPIGEDRRLGHVRLNLSETRRVAHAHGATVNDVVLTVVAGGLRMLVASRGEPPTEPMTALVPVNVRTDGDGPMGNRVSTLLAPLPVEEADACRRLEMVRDAMHERRSNRQAVLGSKLLEMADLLPLGLLSVFTRIAHRQPYVNVVVTNVRGPSTPLYLIGAEVIDVLPVIPLARNLPVGIAVLSYLDTLHIGINADPVACPDHHLVARGIERSFHELLDHLGPADSQ